MLFIFKSPASGDVIMFDENGKEMLRALGKDPADAKGVVTVEQLPAAIGVLKAAIEADKALHPSRDDKPSNSVDAAGQRVRFFQRALPLLELMERSLKDEVPVTWGV